MISVLTTIQNGLGLSFRKKIPFEDLLIFKVLGFIGFFDSVRFPTISCQFHIEFFRLSLKDLLNKFVGKR